MQKRYTILRAAAATTVFSASMSMAAIYYVPAVTQVGDGTTAGIASGVGSTTTIAVYKDGVANQAAPVASASYASGQLVEVGTSGTEGQNANSPTVADNAATGTPFTGTKAYVYSPGYAATDGQANVVNTATAAPRVVGYMTVTSTSVSGATIGTAGTAASTYSNTNFRGAVGDDTATNFYGAGAATGYRYIPAGGTAATPVASFAVSNVPSNVRQVEIRNGQLYGSADTGTGGNFTGIQMLGSGLPTPSANASTNTAPIVLYTSTNSSTASPESFVFMDDTARSTPSADGAAAGFAAVPYNVVYVADAETGTVSSLIGAGIQKWVYNTANSANGDGGWTLAYTIADMSLGAGVGMPMLGVAGQQDGSGNVILYGTTEPSTYNSTTLKTATATATGNELLEFTDSLDSGTAASADATEMVLATAAANTGFRGVALAPVVPEPATLSLLGMGAIGLMARRRK